MLDTYPVNATSAEQAEKATMKRLVLILIKPTQYGKGKFPYVWWRAIMPSNSLAALYSITLKALKHIMPEGIPVEIYALQEKSLHNGCTRPQPWPPKTPPAYTLRQGVLNAISHSIHIDPPIPTRKPLQEAP